LSTVSAGNKRLTSDRSTVRSSIVGFHIADHTSFPIFARFFEHFAGIVLAQARTQLETISIENQDFKHSIHRINLQFRCASMWCIAAMVPECGVNFLSVELNALIAIGDGAIDDDGFLARNHHSSDAVNAGGGVVSLASSPRGCGASRASGGSICRPHSRIKLPSAPLTAGNVNCTADFRPR